MWGGTIDKGALACGKGNRGAGAWLARVRVSAHTVWMCKLLLNHMLSICSFQTCHNPPPRCRRSQMLCRSPLMRPHSGPRSCCSLPTHRTFPGEGRAGRRFGVRRRSLVELGLCWRPGPEWMRVEEVEEEGGLCKHTGDTGTAAGTAGTVGTAASADSTLCMT